MADEPWLFSSDEQRLAVETIADLLGPMDISLMVLGRVAMLYLFGEGRASKDVDLHPFPMADRDLLELQDRLADAVEAGGGHVRWEPDGRSMTVHYPVGDRLVPVEFVLGGEDWISPEVLADAVGTGTLVGQVLIPTPEHLLVMKAEAYHDRRGEPGSARFRDDMVQIADGAWRTGRGLDPVEVRRLVLMRHPRKHALMMDLCASVMPV